MYLSDLQRFILKQTFAEGPRCPRKLFDSFYPAKRKAAFDGITRSLERLIAKGLLVGFGHKTAEKFFIQHVSLTAQGKRVTHEIVLRGQRLPLR